MYYWFSNVANRYYVLDDHHVVKGYRSLVGLKSDYPNAEFCPCVEGSQNAA